MGKDRRKRKKINSNKIVHLSNFLYLNDFIDKVQIKKTRKKISRLDDSFEKEMIIKIPKVFSFTKNPEETIHTLMKVFSFYNRDKFPCITIDFTNCYDLGLAASTALSSIILELEEYAGKCNRSIGFFINAEARNEECQVNDMLKVSGLLEHLKMITKEEQELIRYQHLLMELITNENCKEPVENIVSYYLRVLDNQGFSLNQEGQQLLGEFVGEVFSNIEDHNKDFKAWYAIGHCEKQKLNDCSEVQLAIFNYGVSIYESYEQGDTLEYSKNYIEDLYQENVVKNNLSIDKETYISALSLQRGISRLNSDKHSTRGQGTMDLIDSFAKLGQSRYDGIDPEMSITSGHVTFVFDPKVKGDNNNVFLDENYNIDKNQIGRNIKVNKYHFPGTVISMKFFVDKNYLSEAMSNNGGEDGRD